MQKIQLAFGQKQTSLKDTQSGSNKGSTVPFGVARPSAWGLHGCARPRMQFTLWSPAN